MVSFKDDVQSSDVQLLEKLYFSFWLPDHSEGENLLHEARENEYFSDRFLVCKIVFWCIQE